jgi:HlyD family secretion protein
MASTVLGKSNRPLLWILGLMAGGFLTVGFISYRLIQAPSPTLELAKLTVPATRETLAVEIKASGKIEPIQSVNISPKSPGRLVRLFVEQGMPVKKGQTLAVMDNLEVYAQGMQAEAKAKEAIAHLEGAKRRIPEEIRQYQAKFYQAQATYKQLEARMKQARERIPTDIEQAQAQIQAAQSRYRLAENRVKRNENLVREGAIATDQFDSVLNDYLSAKANLDEAMRRLEQLQKTASPEVEGIQQEMAKAAASMAEAKFALEQRQNTQATEIAALESALAGAKANLEQVKIQYRDTVITAPFDGIVTQKYATEGSFVTPTTSASSTASATSTSIIAIARGLEVVAKVPEVDVGLLQRGQPVQIVADAYPETVFEGRVMRIAPEAVVEENVTSFEVTIGLINGQARLKSKMNVDVTFIGQQLDNALVVPTVAIVTREGKSGVLVPDPQNKPQFKPVSIGLVLDEKTQILSGLDAGEKVFIDLPEGSNPLPNPEKKPR